MYIAEIMYRGSIGHTVDMHSDNRDNNLDVIRQEIELTYPGEEDHVRVTLINQDTDEREDITGEVTCSQK
tara:strand:- start:3529 stop:3738 length:210 start_codon:yes stop_codon:yes gene_type:complete